MASTSASVGLATSAGGVSAATAAAFAPALSPTDTAPRALALRHLHTGERLERVYAVGPRYLPEALSEINHLLRDHYTQQVGQMDPGLLDLLHALRHKLDTDAPVEVISAYRCADTNERLRLTRGGGVARRSLHLSGQAIDIRLPRVSVDDLRDAAHQLQAGGVGRYRREGFVHIDTGRVRSWG